MKKSRNLWYRETTVFILTAIFFFLFARIGIDPHHDGVMLIPAVRVAEGGVLFRDVFYQYGIAVPLFQGLATALFGAELLVIRLLTVLFYAGSAVLLDLLWRRFLPEKLSYFTAVLFCLFSGCTMVTFHSWNSVYALFFMLLTAFFLLRYFEKENCSRRELFYAGLSAGLTWASRTPCGMVTVFAAVLIFFGLNWFTGKNKKTVLAEAGNFAAGTLVIALLALSYILFSGAGEDFIKQNFSYVANFVDKRGDGGGWQYFCDSLFPFYQDDFWYCNSFYAFMPLGAMVMLYFSVREGVLGGHEEMKKELPFAVLLLVGLGSWHQYYPVPCVRHLFWGGAPLLGAYLLMLKRLFFDKRVLSKAGALLLFLVMLLSLYPRFYGIFRRVEFSDRHVSSVPGIRGIRLNDMELNLVHMVAVFEKLPEPLRQRGLLNWTESSLFSVMTKQSEFRDLLFYKGDFYPYLSYDEKVAQYIMQHRCPVLVDHDTNISGYVLVAEAEYLSTKYRLLIPGEFLLDLR